MGISDVIGDIARIFGIVIFVCQLYRYIYLIIGFFAKSKKFGKAEPVKKYAVITAARNEEAVIGKLLESLREQSYPQDMYRIFVVADNCSDRTAEIARGYGAVVYERNEPERARKGYALNFLFKQIERDYGIPSFDGYLFFDADNVVSHDYIEQMNNAFATGADAVVGYRNAKNFGSNFISAAYGIHFMGSTVSYHRPRSRLSLSTHIAGTGYLISSALLKDGWNYEYLTEDTQATMSFVSAGRRIEYCEAAELYDEQPTDMKTMARQRIRWAKGRIACFLSYFGRLFRGIFAPAKHRMNFKKRFSCYDMIFYGVPYFLVTGALGIVCFFSDCISGVIQQGAEYFAVCFREILPSFPTLVKALVSSYLLCLLKGALVAGRERRHINCPTSKLVGYVLLWPWFNITNIPLTVASLFMKVKWKPIKHDIPVGVDEIKNQAQHQKKQKNR